MEGLKVISGNLGGSDPDLDPTLPLDDDLDLRLRCGRHLGTIRRNRQITQEAAALGIKISRPHLSNIEQGHARTGWKGLRDMAQFYDIGIQELIAEVEREMPPTTPQRPVSKTGLLLGPSAVAAQSAPSNGPNTTHILSDDETFVIHIWRALSHERRRNIRKLLADMVAEQSTEFGRR